MTILFTSPTCAYCPAVKRYLKRKGIEYEERDISDRDNVAQLIKVSGRMTVPTLWTDKGVAVGLNYAQINKIIAI